MVTDIDSQDNFELDRLEINCQNCITRTFVRTIQQHLFAPELSVLPWHLCKAVF